MASYLISLNGTFISAGGINVVYSTKNGGKSWASIPLDANYANVPSIVKGQFYLPTGPQVLQSTDGLIWNVALGTQRPWDPPAFSTDSPLFVDLSALAISGQQEVDAVEHIVETPSGALLAFLTTRNGGGALIRSADGFKTFTVSKTWQFPNFVNTGQFARADGSSRIYFSWVQENDFATPQGIKSDDDGLSWSSTTLGLSQRDFIVASGSSLFSFGERGRLWMAIHQDGDRWHAIHRGIFEPISSVFSSPSLNHFVLTTDTGVYLSNGGGWSKYWSSPVEFLSESYLSSTGFIGFTPEGNITTSSDLLHWTTIPGPAIPSFNTGRWNVTGLACNKEYCICGVQENLDFQQKAYIFFTSSVNTGWTAAQVPFKDFSVPRIFSVATGNGAFVGLGMENSNIRVLAPATTAGMPNNWKFLGPSIDVTNLEGSCFLKFVGPPLPSNGKTGFFVVFCQDPRQRPWFSVDGQNWKPLDIPQTIYPLLGVNYLNNAGVFVLSSWGVSVNSTDMSSWREPYAAPTDYSIFDFVADISSPAGTTLYGSSADNSLYTWKST